MEEDTPKKEEAVLAPEDAPKAKNKRGKKVIPILMILLFFAGAAMAYKDFAAGKGPFQQATNVDFASVKVEELGEADMNQLKAEYDALGEALSKDGYDLEANLKKAEILVWLKEYDKAEMIYKKMAQYHALNSGVYKAWGDLYFTQRKYQESEAHYLHAIKLSSKNVDAYVRLAQVYRYVEKDKEGTIRFYEDGIKRLGKNSARLVAYYAYYLERIGENQQAMDKWNALLEKDPENREYQDNVDTLKVKTSKKENPEEEKNPPAEAETAPAPAEGGQPAPADQQSAPAAPAPEAAAPAAPAV